MILSKKDKPYQLNIKCKQFIHDIKKLGVKND